MCDECIYSQCAKCCFMLTGAMDLQLLHPQKMVDQTNACTSLYSLVKNGLLNGLNETARNFATCKCSISSLHFLNILNEEKSTSEMIPSQMHAHTNAPVFAALQAKVKNIVFLAPLTFSPESSSTIGRLAIKCENS